MILLEYKIPDFVRHIKLSDARRARYYKNKETIPERYKNDKYHWVKDKKGNLILTEKVTNLPVVKNKAVVGTPSFFHIEGNKVWQEGRNDKQLQIIKYTLQEYFWEVIKYLSPKDANGFDKPFRLNEPADIEFIFNVYQEGQDCDNLDLFYRKCFLDGAKDQYSLNKGEKKTLIQERVIPDDNKNYVRAVTSRINDCKRGEDSLHIIFKKTQSIIIDYEKESVIQIDSTKLFKNGTTTKLS
jgi:hypothetical protein